MPILNAADIKKYLRGFADFQDAGLQEKLGGHLIAALSGPLKIRPQNLSAITTPNENWPAPLKEKFNTRADPWLQFKPDAGLDDKIRHIADWIKAAMVNDEPWLQETDTQGVPSILRAIKSIDQATELADAAIMLTDDQMHIAQQLWIGKDEEADGHIKLEMQLSDHSRIVRLLTPEALDRESAFLGHCIGKGSYDDKLKTNQWAFYSLRDTTNKPHVTFAVDLRTNTLNQCKGAQDSAPVEKYFPAVREFVTAKKFTLAESASHTGMVFQDGIYYDAYNLPQGFVCKKSLLFTNTKRPLSLPTDLSVIGNLELSYCTLNALPENLHVSKTLRFLRCKILADLPKNVSVGGHIYFSRGISGPVIRACGFDEMLFNSYEKARKFLQKRQDRLAHKSGLLSTILNRASTPQNPIPAIAQTKLNNCWNKFLDKLGI